MSKISQINYDIQFEPIFTNFTFSGTEIITLTTTTTDSFTLNSAELEINSCYIIYKGKTIKVKSSLNKKQETLNIKASKKVSGKIKICIEFQGILNDRLLGFYRSKYKDRTGKTKYLATTQFEAADARRAFPCWDEPAVKATFDVSLLVEKKMTAISNMPERKRHDINSKILVEFERTPIMSTYLLYLGVGEFEFLEDFTKDEWLINYVMCKYYNFEKIFDSFITKLIDLLEQPKAPDFSSECNFCNFTKKQIELKE